MMNAREEWMHAAGLRPKVRMTLSEYESLLSIVRESAQVFDRPEPEPEAYNDREFLRSWMEEAAL